MNKDARTINHKDHNATVLWHVANRYEQWKKQQSAKSLYESANVPVKPLSTLTSGEPSHAWRELSADNRHSFHFLPQSPAAVPGTSARGEWGTDQSLGMGSPGWESPIGYSTDSTPLTQASIPEDLFSMLSTSPASFSAVEGFQESTSPGTAGGHLFNELVTMVDDPAAARAHLKKLKVSIAAQGGILLLDPRFREDLLSCDCYLALKYRTRPIFPVQEWTPGPLSLPWKARLISVGILDDHVTRIDSAIKHPTLKFIFTDLMELFKAHEYVLKHELPPDDQLLRWKQLRRFDCISRLGDLNVDLTIYPHLYEKPMTQLSVTTAASLLANVILGSPEPVRFGLDLLRELRVKLMQSQRDFENDREKRLHLWVLYVGSLAENVYPVNTTDKLWFTSRLNKLASALEVRGWSEMKKLLRQFLFCEYLHQEIVNDRASCMPDFTHGLYSTTGTSWQVSIHESQARRRSARET